MGLFDKLFRYFHEKEVIRKEKIFDAKRLSEESLFAGLTERQLKKISPLLKKEYYSTGSEIIKEGEPADALYILLEGEVTIEKKGHAQQESYVIARLKKGYCFGELAIFNQKKRSATVHAVTDIKVLKLTIADFENLSTQESKIALKLIRNISAAISENLRQTTVATITVLEEKLNLIREKLALSTFVTYIIFLLAFYTIAAGCFLQLAPKMQSTTFVTAPLLVIYTVGTLAMMKATGEPWRIFGLNIDNWRRQIVDALVWSFFFILFLIIVKVLYFWLYNISMDQFIFIKTYFQESMSLKTKIIGVIGGFIYILTIPLQELIARGAMQGSLRAFLPPTPYRDLVAIIISATVFTMTHIHTNMIFALMTFVPGLMWGAMYARHRSLVGVSVSHMIIGFVALFFLGIHKIIRV